MLVVPEEGADRSIAEKVLAERRDRPWPLVGLGMVGVAIAVLLSRADVWPAAGFGWVLVLIVSTLALFSAMSGICLGCEMYVAIARARGMTLDRYPVS